MAAGAWTIPAGNKVKFFDGTHDLDTHTFKIALFSSAYDAANTTAYSTTNELATANGYTQGGNTLGTVSLSESGGTVSWDFADTSWTASGGSITARYAVIYNDTDAGKTIIAYCLLDNTPADVTVTDGNTLTIQIANVLTIT